MYRTKQYYCCFNPRTHTGCDLPDSPTQQCYSEFQSTHPHGVRLTYVADFDEVEMFQSTHPHGVRQRLEFHPFRLIMVSIHAPTRGATDAHNSKLDVNYEFQSTHPHGVRLGDSAIENPFFAVSIHAPTRGATFYQCYRLCI